MEIRKKRSATKTVSVLLCLLAYPFGMAIESLPVMLDMFGIGIILFIIGKFRQKWEIRQ